MKKTRATPARKKKVHFVSLKVKPAKKTQAQLRDEHLAEIRAAQARMDRGQYTTQEEMERKYGLR